MSVCALAVWRGRDDERLGAGGFLAAWALSLAVVRPGDYETQWAILLVDVLLLALLIAVALRTPRFWPLPVAALQALAVTTPLANALDDGISSWAFITAALGFQYMALIVIGYGAITAPRRYAEIEAYDGAMILAAERGRA
jgi:hypothetical protein